MHVPTEIKKTNNGLYLRELHTSLVTHASLDCSLFSDKKQRILQLKRHVEVANELNNKDNDLIYFEIGRPKMFI